MRCHSLPLIAFWRCRITCAPMSAGLTVPVNVTRLWRPVRRSVGTTPSGGPVSVTWAATLTARRALWAVPAVT